MDSIIENSHHARTSAMGHYAGMTCWQGSGSGYQGLYKSHRQAKCINVPRILVERGPILTEAKTAISLQSI